MLGGILRTGYIAIYLLLYKCLFAGRGAGRCIHSPFHSGGVYAVAPGEEDHVHWVEEWGGDHV